jgi:hypothetical protein
MDHIFLTSALIGGEWLASLPCRGTPRRESPGIHRIRCWMGRKAGMDGTQKKKSLTLSGLEIRPIDRPARGLSLYRLRYRECVFLNVCVAFAIILHEDR